MKTTNTTTKATETMTRREANARSHREYALADERTAADDSRGARLARARARERDLTLSDWLRFMARRDCGLWMGETPDDEKPAP